MLKNNRTPEEIYRECAKALERSESIRFLVTELDKHVGFIDHECADAYNKLETAIVDFRLMVATAQKCAELDLYKKNKNKQS